jgi:hypothetical protein
LYKLAKKSVKQHLLLIFFISLGLTGLQLLVVLAACTVGFESLGSFGNYLGAIFQVTIFELYGGPLIFVINYIIATGLYLIFLFLYFLKWIFIKETPE